MASLDTESKSVGRRTAALSEVELQFIEVFVAGADALGIPRSLAEIYGVIFASPQPLAFQQIADRLNLSKGSVSTGLKSLRNFGAVRVTYLAGDRRDYYTPETELRSLIAGLLRDRISPHLDQGRRSLEQLQATMSKAGDEIPSDDLALMRSRAAKLQIWRKQAAMIIPLAGKILG